MTVEDFLDHLFKLGTGWLGWTEAETLDTSMVGIALAYEGRQDMLKAIFGGGQKPGAPEATEKPADPAQIASHLKTILRAKRASDAGKNGIGR